MSAKLLCITLGSAWAYVLRETGQVVANCHKMPQGNFEKRLVPAGECAEGLIASIKAWNEANLRISLYSLSVQWEKKTC